jgi:muramoyltetrapeptide carboxypeptidase
MMINLKLSGKLKNLKGLIVGGMTKIKNTTPDYGKSAYEVITDNTSDGNYPVVFGFQAGHMQPNHALYMGRNVVIDVTDQHSMIRFEV